MSDTAVKIDFDSSMFKIVEEYSKHKNSTFEVGGKTFSYASNISEVKPKIDRAENVKVFSLSSIVNYINNNPDNNEKSNLIVNVLGANKVSVLGILDEQRGREHLITAEYKAAAFTPGNWLTQEDFIIALLRGFQETEDRQKILDQVSNISDAEILTSEDDGISQVVKMKSGVTRNIEGKLPLLLKLKQYRSFPEIEVPETNYVLRIKKAGQGVIMFTLFDFGEGLWELKLVAKIKKYLSDNIKDVTIL